MVEGGQVAVASLATPESAETHVLKEAVVEEVLARLARGERVVAVARSYDIDPKTVRAWRARGRYVPRVRTPRVTQLDPYAAWLRARAPEVDFNAVVLRRELAAQGYAGSAMQVSRFVRPLRVAAREGAAATVRFETPTGQQAQVDFGQRKLWIGDGYLVAIDGSRYSVPVRFVGATVTIRELASGYEIWAGEEPIAQHPRLGRHRVAMEPAHYAGLLRPGGRSALPPLPPRWDPGYPAGADVEVRDLATYAALVEAGA